MPKKKTRSDGLVEKKITIGHTAEGNPIRKSFYGHSDKDVQEKIKEYHKQESYGTVDKKITLAEWADKWLVTYKEGNVRGMTYAMYENAINTHIKPYFKAALLSMVKPFDIMQFLNSKSACSQSLLDQLKITLNAMFNAAIDNEKIVRNPAKGLKPKSSQVKGDKRAYTFSEAADLVSFAKTHKDGAPIITILKTGLRREELCGLKWSDIDMKAGTLSVRRVVTFDKNRAVLEEPKTKSSIRTLVVDDELARVFALIPRHTNIGKLTVQNEFVFSNSRGGMLHPGNWSRRTYAKFMDDYKNHFIAEYKKVNNDKEPKTLPRLLLPHELRHTFGTLYYKDTRDIFMTMRVMGHSNVQVTIKNYMHDGLEEKQTAQAKVIPFQN